MTLLPATVVAFGLLGAADEGPSNKPRGGEVVPETRVEPKKSPEGTGPHGAFLLRLRLNGPRFKVQGEGTQEKPLEIDLPVGDFLTLRILQYGTR